MRKLLLICLFLFPIAAFAANEPLTTGSGGDKMSVQKAGEMRAAINVLDQGFDELDADKKSVKSHFKFSADTLWSLSRDLAILNQQVEAYQKAAQALFAQYEDKDHKIPPGPKLDEFNAENQKLLNREIDIPKLERIKKSDLMKAGPVPIAVISALLPIIVE